VRLSLYGRGAIYAVYGSFSRCGLRRQERRVGQGAWALRHCWFAPRRRLGHRSHRLACQSRSQRI